MTSGATQRPAPTVRLRRDRADQHRALLRSLRVLGRAPVLTLELMLELHTVLLPPSHPDRGRFRDGPVSVRFNGIVQWVPPPAEVALARTQASLDRVAAALAAGLEGEAAVDVAGRILFAITDLHPFPDGNGRVARALATWVLLQGGWALLMDPGIYCHDRRAEYYRALDSHSRDPTLWPRFFAELTAFCFVRKDATGGAAPAEQAPQPAMMSLDARSPGGEAVVIA